MKRNFIILTLTICILIIGSIVYIYLSPPLSTPGVSYFIDDDTKRIVEIVNNRFTNIKIKKVLVNGYEPRKVELGVSRSSQMVLGSGLEENPHITFHMLDEFLIKPKLDPYEKIEKIEKGDIVHYGIRVFGYEEPKELTIKYTYLGIPLKKHVNVER